MLNYDPHNRSPRREPGGFTARGDDEAGYIGCFAGIGVAGLFMLGVIIYDMKFSNIAGAFVAWGEDCLTIAQ
jgi:hypothetical protein